MIILILYIAVICFFLFLMRRNQRVHDFRMDILSRASYFAKLDIQMERPWEWRFDGLKQSTYDDMLFRFWKKLTPENFYQDTKFLKP